MLKCIAGSEMAIDLNFEKPSVGYNLVRGLPLPVYCGVLKVQRSVEMNGDICIE